MRNTIKEIATDNSLFYDNDWFIGSDKLVAIHGKDKSTEHKIKDGHILCSFRKNNGFGDQYQINISNDTGLKDRGTVNTITYSLVKNPNSGDWRIVEKTNGEWTNEFDNNWTFKQAQYQADRLMQGYELDLEPGL